MDRRTLLKLGLAGAAALAIGGVAIKPKFLNSILDAQEETLVGTYETLPGVKGWMETRRGRKESTNMSIEDRLSHAYTLAKTSPSISQRGGLSNYEESASRAKTAIELYNSVLGSALTEEQRKKAQAGLNDVYLDTLLLTTQEKDTIQLGEYSLTIRKNTPIVGGGDINDKEGSRYQTGSKIICDLYQNGKPISLNMAISTDKGNYTLNVLLDSLSSASSPRTE